MTSPVRDDLVTRALRPFDKLTQIHPDETVRAAVAQIAHGVQSANDLERRLVRAATINRLEILRAEWSLEEREALVDAYMQTPSAPPEPKPRSVEWPEPRDLPDLPPVPAWDDSLLPDSMRDWSQDISERMQCPPEYSAVVAIVSMGSVIGRGCAIRPKRHDTWTVVPNLWGAIVGPPSAMKTPAMSEAMGPLFQLATRACDEHAGRSFDREILQARRVGLAKQVQEAARKGQDLSVLRQQHAELEATMLEANKERRYLVYDTSIEALGEILKSNPRGVLLCRDELVGFLKTLERQGHESDRAFYLEAWNGTNAFVSDRIGRGTVRIEAACVSIIGGIQPGPLGEYLRGAMDGGAGADGFIQRFQLIVYPDTQRSWRNVDRKPDEQARARVVDVFRRFAELTPEGVGADVSAKLPFLHFDPDAQLFFDAWQSDLMQRARSGEEHEAFEGHLVKYASLMPSLALIFHLADVGRGPVGLPAAMRAARFCELLEAHARRVYASVSAAKFVAARQLQAKLRAGKLSSPFAVRDVYRAQWSGLTDRDTVNAAIAVLEEYGWVRREVVSTGGRDRVQVHVHPMLRPAQVAAE